MVRLDSEEIIRRERIIIDDYNGIQPTYEAFYLEAIRYAANCATEAFERYDDAIEAQDAHAVVAYAHEALSHAAAVSRFFWTPGKQSLLKTHRAAKLRKAFGLDDSSPLANRSIRNALEHFDERLDEYSLLDNVGYFFPGPMVDNSELADEMLGHIFRLVDPRENVFVLCGKKFMFGPIREAVREILHGATYAFENGGRLGGHGDRYPQPNEGPVPMHLREDFREMAKAALERAKVELAANDDQRLRYASVELRIALEALTYDRATAYKDELPQEHFSTWQPGKLLKALLEIDPRADRSRTIRMRRQEEAGQKPKTMKLMGTDVALSLRTIKDHYDALSSFIHMPTLKKLEDGWKPDPTSVRRHCYIAAEAIQKVVDSRLFRTNFARTSEINCFRCGKLIKRRLSDKKGIGETKCFECGAPHRYSVEPDNRILWQPVIISVTCTMPNCGHVYQLFDDEIKPGTHWRCPGCQTRYGITLAVYNLDAPGETSEGSTP